jgi:hypothetical protein
LAFRSGWNAKQVQLLLGHHSPAFTLAVYVHLLPDDLPEPDFLDSPRGDPSESQEFASGLVPRGGEGRGNRPSLALMSLAGDDA